MLSESDALTFPCGHQRTFANTYRSTRASGRTEDKCRCCDSAYRKTFRRRRAAVKAQ